MFENYFAQTSYPLNGSVLEQDLQSISGEPAAGLLSTAHYIFQRASTILAQEQERPLYNIDGEAMAILQMDYDAIVSTPLTTDMKIVHKLATKKIHFAQAVSSLLEKK